MDSDSELLATCIHHKAWELQKLLEDVVLKFPGKQGEQWANWYLEVTRKLVDETNPDTR